MAHYMENKNSFSITGMLKNAISVIHGLTILYAFLTITYWLFYVTGVKIFDSIAWPFTSMWSVVGQYYTYKPMISGEYVDFTGIVSAILVFILAAFIKSLEQFLPDFQPARAMNNSFEHNSQTSAVAKAAADPTMFVFLLDVKLTNISNFIQDSKISNEEINDIKTKFFEALLANLNHNHILQKGFYKKKLYIVYKSFDKVDNFIFYTKETLNSLSREFSKPTLRIDFLVGLSCLTDIEELKKEISLMDIVLCLNLVNEFITTSGFKTHYDTKIKKQYSLSAKGIYNLSQNLNIMNNQEVYTLRESNY